MIKYFRNILILLIFTSCISESSGQLEKKDVISGARILGESLIKQNWEEYKNLTPPKLFELMGGLENAKNYITAQWKEDNKNGIRLRNFTIDSCTNISRYKDEYQSSLQISFEYETDSTIIKTQSTILAFTNDKGKHWYYLDTYSTPLDKIYSFFPNISKELIIFKKGEPIVKRKE